MKNSDNIQNIEEYTKNLEIITNKISKYYQDIKNNYIIENNFLKIRKKEKLSTAEHMTMINK